MINFKACVFNAYGALLDTYLPFEKYRDQLGENALLVYKLWRAKRLQYASLRSLMDQHTDYSQITRDALDFACDVYGVNNEQLKTDLIEAYTQLQCYPDVKDTLDTLKEHGLVLAVLSNATPKRVSSTLKFAGIDELIDRVFSTDQVHAYKPSPAVYEFIEQQLGMNPKQICFVSSNSWDVAGAVCYGIYSVWINRFDRKPERVPFPADAEIKALTALPQVLKA